MNMKKQKCENCENWNYRGYCIKDIGFNSPLDWCPLWTKMSKENPRQSEFALKVDNSQRELKE